MTRGREYRISLAQAVEVSVHLSRSDASPERPEPGEEEVQYTKTANQNEPPAVQPHADNWRHDPNNNKPLNWLIDPRPPIRFVNF